MIKDTNPDHFKVDGANFIEYMNDPKISGFGNWMFANGYNSGVWACTNWISVKDRLPEDARDVLICAKDYAVTTGCYIPQSGEWWRDGSNCPWDTVTHWMPLPEPPEVES